MSDKVCAYGHGPDCPCLKDTVEQKMANRKSHTWRIKRGWKASYQCAKCGIDDMHHDAQRPCGEADR